MKEVVALCPTARSVQQALTVRRLRALRNPVRRDHTAMYQDCKRQGVLATVHLVSLAPLTPLSRSHAQKVPTVGWATLRAKGALLGFLPNHLRRHSVILYCTYSYGCARVLRCTMHCSIFARCIALYYDRGQAWTWRMEPCIFREISRCATDLQTPARAVGLQTSNSFFSWIVN